MKKGKLWKRTLSILLSLAVIAYLGFQIYSLNHDVIKTEYALDYTYYHTIPLQGFVVRDEAIVSASGTGVVGYCQTSGSKVSAGHVVAKVFSSNEQAAIQTEIDEIDNTIKNLQELQMDGTRLSANAQVLDSRINDTINRLLTITDTGSTAGTQGIADDLIQLLNKKQIALDASVDFTAYLADLKAQKASLESSLHSFTEITADRAGYFINGVDGYENILSYETICEIDRTQLETALASEKQPVSGIGKIVSSSEWYMSAIVDQSVLQHLALGDSVDITIPRLSDDVYSCRVDGLNADYSAGSAVIVLYCAQMNEAIASARIEKADLRMNTYHGIRVNQQALRVVDGITGVYVVDGISAKFKPVEILYSDTGFAICAYDSTNSNNLKQYDEVIVEGGDLYDGKIIR